MTEQTLPPEPIETPPLVVEAPADSKLATLHAAYGDAQAAFNEAKARLDAIKDGIKLELTRSGPEGTAAFELRGPGAPLSLSWTVSRRFDTKRFAREQPGVYDSYRTVSGSWVLKGIGGQS